MKSMIIEAKERASSWMEKNKLMKNKKGFVSMGSNILYTAIVGLILIALLFEFAAVLFPQVQTSAETLCNSGIPLASLFKSDGVVVLVLVAAMILAVVAAVKLKGGK